MNTQTQTPRTDAEQVHHLHDMRGYVPADFARTLELELAHLQERERRLVQILEDTNRMLEMCVQLVGDSPHVNKVIFINEQIAANRLALNPPSPGQP